MELIDRDKLIETIQEVKCWKCEDKTRDDNECYSCLLEKVVDAPAVDYIPKDAETVPRCVLDQIRWERDMAMESLKEIGVGFCEKTDDVVRVVRCKDCKWWEYVDTWDGHQVGSCEFVEMLTDPDGYCYRAERKEVQE